MPEPGEITLLLRQIDREGDDEGALEALFRVIETDLRKIATKKRKAFYGLDFSTTALMDLAFVKLVHGNADWSQGGRRKFLGFVSRKMHDILIDEYRKMTAEKQFPAEKRVDLEGNIDQDCRLGATGGASDFYLDLKGVLEELDRGARHEEAEIFRHRHFLNSTFAEIAELLGGISVSTAQKKYGFAANWVRYRLRDYFPSSDA